MSFPTARTARAGAEDTSVQELLKQFAKHAVVGTIAFLVDFCCLVALVELVGLNPLVASAIAFVTGVVVSYLGSMRFVFQHDPARSRRQEFIIYLVLSTIGLGLNSLGMYLGEQIIVTSGMQYEGTNLYMLVKLLVTMMVTVYNFWSRRRWLDAGSN